jgi:hypothetical protein
MLPYSVREQREIVDADLHVPRFHPGILPWLSMFWMDMTDHIPDKALQTCHVTQKHMEMWSSCTPDCDTLGARKVMFGFCHDIKQVYGITNLTYNVDD